MLTSGNSGEIPAQESKLWPREKQSSFSLRSRNKLLTLDKLLSQRHCIVQSQDKSPSCTVIAGSSSPIQAENRNLVYQFKRVTQLNSHHNIKLHANLRSPRWAPRHSLCYRLMCFFFNHILTSYKIYYWTDSRQHGIYLLNMFILL